MKTYKLNKPVWLLIALLISLTACGSTEIISQPVPVEVEVVKYIPVPNEHLRQISPSIIPANLTYGEALQLWAKDRASIVTLNSQLQAIRKLTDGSE